MKSILKRKPNSNVFFNFCLVAATLVVTRGASLIFFGEPEFPQE